jgi:hypothetical protein
LPSPQAAKVLQEPELKASGQGAPVARLPATVPMSKNLQVQPLDAEAQPLPVEERAKPLEARRASQQVAQRLWDDLRLLVAR